MSEETEVEYEKLDPDAMELPRVTTEAATVLLCSSCGWFGFAKGEEQERVQTDHHIAGHRERNKKAAEVINRHRRNNALLKQSLAATDEMGAVSVTAVDA